MGIMYGVAAFLRFVGSVGSVGHRGADIWRGLGRALGTPQLRRLAPVWICMNAIFGLWLGPTLYFLLTNRSDGSQVLAGLFADNPSRPGRLLLAYALLVGSGVLAWSRALTRIVLRHALLAALLALICVTARLL